MRKLHIKATLSQITVKNTGDDEKCYREIVMVVLNLKRVASATAKSEKARKFTAQTAQPI
jgi:hypothetical protein